ncbi:MAG: hypothetical protein R6U10_06650 [Thermoplasmatota archaeon]
MKKDVSLRVRHARIRLLGVVHGLEREGRRVREAFLAFEPDCCAVGIPGEDVETLRQCHGDENPDFDTTPEREAFFQRLATYGTVVVPPAGLVAAMTLADERDVALEPIDMDDEEYASLFTDEMSLLGLMFNQWKNRRAEKKSFDAGSAEEFVLAWDGMVNATRSFRSIKRAQEKHMVDRLWGLAGRHSRILAVVPIERFDGVASGLGL